MNKLFNKKLKKVKGINPITKEPIEFEREIWNYECLEFICDEDDLKALSKVETELTEKEFNVIIEGFNYILNDKECKDLLDDEDRERVTYALGNLDKEQCRIYLIIEDINILDEHFHSGMAEKYALSDEERGLYKKLREALTDEEKYCLVF